MTPKEKAEELIEKMKEFQEGYWRRVNAEECALIAVDEMMSISTKCQDYELSVWLREVKNEIEKL